MELCSYIQCANKNPHPVPGILVNNYKQINTSKKLNTSYHIGLADRTTQTKKLLR